MTHWGFPGGTVVKESTCQLKRCRFDPWGRKIPWKRKWQPTSVFLPGKSHGQRSLTGYNPRGHKELDRTEPLSRTQPRNWPNIWYKMGNFRNRQVVLMFSLHLLENETHNEWWDFQVGIILFVLLLNTVYLFYSIFFWSLLIYSVNKRLTIFEQSNLIKITEEIIKIRKGAFWVEAALPPRSKVKEIRWTE